MRMCLQSISVALFPYHYSLPSNRKLNTYFTKIREHTVFSRGYSDSETLFKPSHFPHIVIDFKTLKIYGAVFSLILLIFAFEFRKNLFTCSNVEMKAQRQTQTHTHACTQAITRTYRVSQEEWTKLRESVPYVKIYRYNPKHLYPKLNGYGDNGHRKLWVSGGSTFCTPSVTPYSSTSHARQRDIVMQ